MREPKLREVVKARLIAGVLCISIPKSLRDVMELSPGDRVMMELEDEKLIVKKE